MDAEEGEYEEEIAEFKKETKILSMLFNHKLVNF